MTDDNEYGTPYGAAWCPRRHDGFEPKDAGIDDDQLNAAHNDFKVSSKTVNFGKPVENFEEARLFECRVCQARWLVDVDSDVYEVRMFTKEEGNLLTDLVDSAYETLNGMLKMAGVHRHEDHPIAKAVSDRFWELSNLRSVARGQMWLDIHRNPEESE